MRTGSLLVGVTFASALALGIMVTPAQAADEPQAGNAHTNGWGHADRITTNGWDHPGRLTTND